MARGRAVERERLPLVWGKLAGGLAAGDSMLRTDAVKSTTLEDSRLHRGRERSWLLAADGERRAMGDRRRRGDGSKRPRRAAPQHTGQRRTPPDGATQAPPIAGP